MKILNALILFVSINSFAKSIDVKTLSKFTKENGYSDNQISSKKEKKFLAFKGADDSIMPFTSVEAYNGDTSFKTVALNCDACGLKEITSEQIQICQSDFKKLYKTVMSKDLSTKTLNLIVATSSSKEILNTAEEKIKISSGFLKCGGMRLQVSLDLQ